MSSVAAKTWASTPEDGSSYKVLFVNPPSVPYNKVIQSFESKQFDYFQTVAMPMGILYLSAVLERSLPGIEVQILDIAKAYNAYSQLEEKPDHTFESFVLELLENEIADSFVPDFVGISILFSTAHKSTSSISKVLKHKWPNAPIITGGMHATNAVDSLLEFKNVDYVCRGEGEIVITDLAKAFHYKSNPEAITGIIGRSKLISNNQSIKCLETATMVNDLDTIPFPAWHLIPIQEYISINHGRARKLDAVEQHSLATIMTTRGCPFLCTFCSSWTVHGRKMRYRSADNVISELTQLRELYKVDQIVPEDDLFTVKKIRILELLTKIRDKFGNSFHFQFPNGLSVATLDREVLKAMKDVGMDMANIAIESGSPTVQKTVIKKNCNLDRAVRVLQDCQDLGIVARVYFILGFPGETRAQMQETIDYAARIPSDWNVFQIASPLIGTEMFEQLLERGDIDQNFNWDDAFYYERDYETKEISAKELKDLSYTANININFFGNFNLRNGKYDKAILLFNDILRSYPGHLIAQYCIAAAQKRKGDAAAYEISINKCRDMLQSTKNQLSRVLFDRFYDQLPDLHDVKIENNHLQNQFFKKGPRPGAPRQARQVP